MKRLILMSLALAGLTFAQGPAPGPGQQGPRGPIVPAALKTYLALSDTQVQALIDLRKTQAEENKPILEQIRTKAEALREEMNKTSPDPAVVGKLMVEMKQLRESLKEGRGEVNPAAVAILTPEQQAKLKALSDALTLAPAANQAAGLGLIARPDPPAGLGPAGMPGMGAGMGAGMGGGVGPMGAGMGRRGARF